MSRQLTVDDHRCKLGYAILCRTRIGIIIDSDSVAKATHYFLLTRASRGMMRFCHGPSHRRVRIKALHLQYGKSSRNSGRSASFSGITGQKHRIRL